MSRTLAEYLGVSNSSFLYNIRLLEKASSNPSVDIKLALEIDSNSKYMTARLGLDPSDTTCEEVYEELKQRFLRDNDNILKKINEVNDNSTLSSIITLNLKDIAFNNDCFALKHSVVKKQLKVVPPKTLLKKLGYRSIDSLLKREASAVILASALLVESDLWKQQYYDLYKKLTPSDFEIRKIEIFEPRTTRNWQALSKELLKKTNSTVLSSMELGGLVVLPLPAEVKGLIAATVIFALEQINQIRIYSVFCKLQQVTDSFGQIIADTSQGKIESLALIAEQDVPWHIIQKFYDRYIEKFPIEIFEPHVQGENIQLIDIEEIMSMINPSFNFWNGGNNCAIKEKLNVVSFNLKDVAINAINNRPYKERSISYFRESLWAEMMLRYISHSSLEETMVSQIDSKLIGGQVDDGFRLDPAFSAII